jgi:hypothetical protein
MKNILEDGRIELSGDISAKIGKWLRRADIFSWESFEFQS